MALSSTSIFLSWDPPLPGERNGDITGYVINVTDLNTGETQQFLTSLASNRTFDNLGPFTVYLATISARTAVGVGPFSGISNVRTLEDGN